jgi:serine/threonine protein kinase
MILAPHTLFDGKFEIVSELGHGGMGQVYKAIQLDLQRTVAIKVISGRSLNAKARLRLQREAIAISSLHTPSFVHVSGSNIVLKRMKGLQECEERGRSNASR